jgi:hypothetical protein
MVVEAGTANRALPKAVGAQSSGNPSRPEPRPSTQLMSRQFYVNPL